MGLDFSSHHVMHRYFYLYFTPTTRKAGLCILSTVRVNITAAESYTGWFKKKVHFWGDNTDISEKNVCLILKGYRNRAFGGYRTNSVRFLFVGMGEERSLRKKGGYMRRIARPAFWMSLPARRIVNINSDEQHAIFALELQNAPSLTVGFSTICCEL